MYTVATYVSIYNGKVLNIDTVRHKIFTGEILMNLMNFQQFVNVKIFYLGTADKFVATWLHPKI